MIVTSPTTIPGESIPSEVDSASCRIDYAGMFRDDPLIDEWKEAMAEHRRLVDASHDEQDDS
jgi:hypothetical protein